jgi:hypothetical protein
MRKVRPAARGEVLNLLHLSGTGDQAIIPSTMLTAESVGTTLVI